MDIDMPMSEIMRSLSWVDFLSPLSEGELEDLARGASLVRLERGEELVVGNEEQAERMLIALEGQLQVYEVALGSGRELTLSVLDAGSAVGATGLVPRWVRNLHIRALELLGGVPHRAPGPGGAGAHQPRGGLGLSRMLATQLMLMEDRWADMVEKEVSARLAGVLYMLAESEGVMTPEGPMIPTRYTHAQLASMIGANREAVTRAIGELREGGCVEVKRRHVYVKDFDALRRDAGE
jgi:CRP/FNR family transcriptional regulator